MKNTVSLLMFTLKINTTPVIHKDGEENLKMRLQIFANYIYKFRCQGVFLRNPCKLPTIQGFHCGWFRMSLRVVAVRPLSVLPLTLS